MTFAEELERQLSAKKWSQRDLAESLDTSQPTVSRWLTGEGQPERDTFRLMCQVLSSDPHDHARLLVGRLNSQLDLPGGELIAISLGTTGSLLDHLRPTQQTELERAEAYLHQYARNKREAAELLLDLATCLGFDPAPIKRRAGRAGPVQTPAPVRYSDPLPSHNLMEEGSVNSGPSAKLGDVAGTIAGIAAQGGKTGRKPPSAR